MTDLNNTTKHLIFYNINHYDFIINNYNEINKIDIDIKKNYYYFKLYATLYIIENLLQRYQIDEKRNLLIEELLKYPEITNKYKNIKAIYENEPFNQEYNDYKEICNYVFFDESILLDEAKIIIDNTFKCIKNFNIYFQLFTLFNFGYYSDIYRCYKNETIKWNNKYFDEPFVCECKNTLLIDIILKLEKEHKDIIDYNLYHIKLDNTATIIEYKTPNPNFIKICYYELDKEDDENYELILMDYNYYMKHNKVPKHTYNVLKMKDSESINLYLIQKPIEDKKTIIHNGYIF